MIRAQIVGATGYGGLGMTELLSKHPQIQLTSLLAKNDVGKPVSDFFPHLRGFCDMVVDEVSEDRIGRDCDLVIFATPDRVGMANAKRVVEKGVAMLDYSGDFRFGSVEQYAEYATRHPSTAGKPHVAPELLAQSVYGIPELFRKKIKGAKLVGNPGCFAVAMTLGLAPAVKAGIIDPRSIIVDGKTGSSGAGKKPGPVHHYPERNENVTPYRVASHQHTVEVVQTLTTLLPGEGKIGLTFVPHVVPTTRGILCTSYATLSQALSTAEATELYREFYAGEPFVRVSPAGQIAVMKYVVGSNLCDISVTVDAANGRLIVISAIDNLLKGQAGVALQNINIMMGLPETMGLERAPIYP